MVVEIRNKISLFLSRLSQHTMKEGRVTTLTGEMDIDVLMVYFKMFE